ncbi:LysR family transcriptional regulator [Lapidilactobacillus luobeiensis]|uniref:LysR family transcriptional regulator n=1 Tax=Lapidilactobacillus luobeiensis TaxID=2950371 RepID=UPI0021C474B8|nr:LysR family transcriptional regulator [Lapidilactobacillus luobeiensis]
MELRVLRYFITVVGERNISRAAEKLHVSQPTISRQLKDLETELGVTLFERGQHNITLTPAGDYFAKQARQILTLADKTVGNLQQTPELTGQVLIGCAEAPLMTTVAAASQQLHRSAPKIKMSFTSTDATGVEQQMRAGILDFGVIMEPHDKTGFNFLSLPGTTTWGLLLRRDDPLATQPTIHPADLTKLPLIVSQQHGTNELFDQWLGSNQIHLQVVAQYNLLYNASLLAQAGLGAVLCLDGIINTTGSELVFVPLAPRLDAHASLIWSRDLPLSGAAQAFLEAVKAQVAPTKKR